MHHPAMPAHFRLLGLLGPVFRTPLFAVLDPKRVERAPDNVIADAGQIFYTTAAYQNNRMFLQVVADTGDIGRHFNAGC